MQTGTLYQKLFDPDLRKTHKYTMFLNVVYKAMKIDDDGPRVLSYVKRLLQLCLSTTNASFTCGVLFLISEVGKYQEQLKSHLQNLNIVKATSKEDQYDATKRDPSHAHAETTPLWELSMLKQHYHPSVRSFASSLISEELDNKIIYSGDPLLDFSTSAFLERFSYRNPSTSAQHLYSFFFFPHCAEHFSFYLFFLNSFLFFRTKRFVQYISRQWCGWWSFCHGSHCTW